MRRELITLRTAGLLILILGIYLWWKGGILFPFKYGDVEIPLPTHLLLVVLGAWCLSHPTSLLQFVSWFVPEKKGKRFHTWIGKLGAKPPIKLGGTTNPSEIAAVVDTFIRNYYRRLAVLALALIVFVFFVLPLLVVNLVSTSSFRRESNRLIKLVQETRIEFSSGDHFREHLHDAEPFVHDSSPRSTSTRRIYDILKKLYEPSIKDPISFQNELTKVYEEEIKPNILPGSGVLRIDSINAPQSSSESPIARVTLLTLLAIVSNTQGDHGKYVEPYIQGHQLLSTALERSANDSLPAASNASGVNNAGLLKCYENYSGKFSEDRVVADQMRSIFQVSGPVSRLTLARTAIRDYSKAADQSQSNLSVARALNNKADVLLTLLHKTHQGGGLNEKDIKDESDRHFLVDQLAHPSLTSGWRPQMVFTILDRLKKDLDDALLLSREPEIFFTRAQLYALGGSLSEKYKPQDLFWSNIKAVADAALNDLKAASSMQLPKRYFEENNASRFYLDWLWNKSELRESLNNIVLVAGSNESRRS